jgi:hypothetical protein
MVMLVILVTISIVVYTAALFALVTILSLVTIVIFVEGLYLLMEDVCIVHRGWNVFLCYHCFLCQHGYIGQLGCHDGFCHGYHGYVYIDRYELWEAAHWLGQNFLLGQVR